MLTHSNCVTSEWESVSTLWTGTVSSGLLMLTVPSLTLHSNLCGLVSVKTSDSSFYFYRSLNRRHTILMTHLCFSPQLPLSLLFTGLTKTKNSMKYFCFSTLVFLSPPCLVTIMLVFVPSLTFLPARLLFIQFYSEYFQQQDGCHNQYSVLLFRNSCCSFLLLLSVFTRSVVRAAGNLLQLQLLLITGFAPN